MITMHAQRSMPTTRKLHVLSLMLRTLLTIKVGCSINNQFMIKSSMLRFCSRMVMSKPLERLYVDHLDLTDVPQERTTLIHSSTP